EGEQSCRNGTGEDERVADQGDAAENKRPEPAGANGGGDGSDANGNDRGRPNTGKDDGESKREAHAKKNLRARHAHGFGRFEDRRINPSTANVSIPKNRKQRVENQRDDGGALVDAAGKGNRNQASADAETRDGS